MSDLETEIWQEYADHGVQVVGISSQSEEIIQQFALDNGISFPMLRDIQGVYSMYYIPGGQSPYPRDFIVDQNGILQYASTEYDGDAMEFVVRYLVGPIAPVLDIGVEGSELLLEWSSVPGGLEYRLLRSEDAYDFDAAVTVYQGPALNATDPLGQSAFYKVVAELDD